MLKDLKLIRYSILKSSYESKEGHIGSSFSILEIIYVIFKYHFQKNYFIISKGHASIGIYTVLNFFKYLSNKTLNSFCKFNSKLGGHPDSTKLPMLNFSTGSLGHGLPNSTGLAYALKLKKSKKKVICLLGDQELMEGTTWESLHIIDNYKINNLIIVIDRNNSDFRSIKFIDLKKKLSVFSKNIYHLDGHNLVNIKKLFSKCLSNNKFNIIIANTIKGYGIKSMHDNPEWHHKFPNSEELKRFKEELKI